MDIARTASSAFTDTERTRLGEATARGIAANPGKNGIRALSEGRDAFAARILLAGAAQRSLDLQYYIWHRDTTGRLLWEAAWHAAERGVRVRMLLDDANTRGLDATIAVLDAHPNIEVRLFNPFASRGLRPLQSAFDFARVNRRMHNKALIADNQAAIVGGRNIGDEYFGAGPGVGFTDLDVVAIGPVVREVSAEFDRYWNSVSAYPASALVPAASGDAEKILREEWEAARAVARQEGYEQDVRESTIVRDLLAGNLRLEWSHARVVADDPGKVLSDAPSEGLLPHLEKALGRPERELDLVSPYFVPGRDGVDAFTRLAARGVRVRVLTNSLSATDVAPVHAGYSKYREELLRGGVRLFELKADPAKRDRREREGSHSSSASLHAKTFAVDRRRLFVGSFNLDPRSHRLNTEMGVVIESPALAGQLGLALDGPILENAYEVRLAPGGGLEWIERTGASETVHTTEPRSSALRRAWVEFLTLLPIEWLL